MPSPPATGTWTPLPLTAMRKLSVAPFGAAAFGKRFRLYSIVSGVVLITFGALTFVDAPRLGAGLPTPWIGLWERINIGVFVTWVVVLASVLLRAARRAAAADLGQV